MTITKTLISTGVLAAFVGFASPAVAEHHGGGHSGGGSGSRGSAVSRGASRAASPRESSAQREQSAPRESGALRQSSASRVYSGNRGVAIPRGVASARAYNSGFVRVAPARFFRPYYSFRPRFSLGFGLWAGYPIAYPYAYYDPFYDPYSYAYPPAYGAYGSPYPSYGSPYPSYGSPYPATGYPADPQSAYPPSSSGSIGVQPGQANTSNMGGVSFEITPSDAQVFVDGKTVGTVGQFTPTTQPVGLTVGRHRIEIRAPGYQTIAVDVNILAGQVIPYQGTMERQ